MKCNNCGADFAEGSKFCSVCGQPVESQEAKQPEQVAQQSVAQPTQSEMSNQQMQGQSVMQQPVQNQAMQGQPMPPKKKKSKGFKAAVAIGCVAAIAVVGVAGAQIVKMIQKSNMSPIEHYQAVEKKNRDKGAEVLEGYYGAIYGNLTSDSINKKANMKVSISDTAKSLLSLSGVDFSAFDNAEIEMDYSKEKDSVLNQMILKTNDQQLLSAKSYINAVDKKMYFQIPELSKSYLDGSASLALAEDDESMKSAMNMLNMGEMLPETKDVTNFYVNYTDIVIDQVKDVKAKEEKVEVDSISQDTTALSTTLKNKDIQSLSKKIALSLQEDKSIEKIIGNLDGEAYTAYQSGLGSIISSSDEPSEDNDTTIDMVLNVNDDDEIVGRTITIKGEDESIVLKCLCPMDGDKFAAEYSISVGDVTYVTLKGNGTKKKDVMNGDFSLSVDDSLNTSANASIVSLENVLRVKIEDYDMSKLKEGAVSGTVTYSTDSIAALANYSLKIKSEGNMKSAKSTINILAGKDALATIDMTVDEGEKLEGMVPTEADTVYDMTNTDQMALYQSELDVIALLTDFQQKSGIDISTYIASLSAGNDLTDGSSLDGIDSSANDLYGDGFDDLY